MVDLAEVTSGEGVERAHCKEDQVGGLRDLLLRKGSLEPLEVWGVALDGEIGREVDLEVRVAVRSIASAPARARARDGLVDDRYRSGESGSREGDRSRCGHGRLRRGRRQ